MSAIPQTPKRLCIVRENGDEFPGWTGDYYNLKGYLDPISGHIPELPQVSEEDEIVAYFPASGDAHEDAVMAPATAMWLALQLGRSIRVFGLSQPREVDPEGHWFDLETG